MTLFEPFSPALLGLVAVAALLDLLMGDPRCLPHPVVGIGRVIAWLERAWNHGSPGRGTDVASGSCCWW
nr:cobalamin biosynthesis protein [Halomonas elongata]